MPKVNLPVKNLIFPAFRVMFFSQILVYVKKVLNPKQPHLRFAGRQRLVVLLPIYRADQDFMSFSILFFLKLLINSYRHI